MMAIGTWLSLALGALALLVATGGAPGTPAAIDSPRLEQVTCDGLRIRQRGLPARTAFIVEVTNPESGEEFARQEVRSSGAGVLDARVVADFDGARQLAVEVEAERAGEDVEFAEAIHEFDRPCPAAGQTSSPARRRTGVVTTLLVAVTAITFVIAGWAVRLLRPGRG